ncbi:MAG: hypothetical protein PQ975_11140 [Methanobacterium sp.]
MKEVERVGFKIKGLCLDREFYTAEIINYLQEAPTSTFPSPGKR